MNFIFFNFLNDLGSFKNFTHPRTYAYNSLLHSVGNSMKSKPITITNCLTILIALTGCGSLGGGGGCGAGEPLTVSIPDDQILESGLQLRVTESGTEKIIGLIEPVVRDAISNASFCMPKRRALGVDFCETNHGSCNQGCDVALNLDYLSLDIVSDSAMRMSAQFDAETDVNADAGILGDCTFDVSVSNVQIETDIIIGVDPQTGELTVGVDNVDLGNINVRIDGCGFLGDVVNGIFGFVSGFFDSAISNFVVGLVEPLLSSMVADLLPDPLGFEQKMFVGQSLGGTHDSGMETSVLIGGYANFAEGGISLGGIVGLNADSDPSTRDATNASEPSRCVPAHDVPNLLAAPWNLAVSSRGRSMLNTDSLFDGAADPADTDFLMGISQTTFDLLGHHLVASGGLCIEFSTEQLSISTLTAFLPSLGELKDPNGGTIRLVVRPLYPLGFNLGDGDAASPHVGVALKDLQIDFYANLWEREVRLFTIGATMNIGLNLDVVPQGADLAIEPTIVGLDSSSITITATNGEFIREDPKVLEEIIPDLIDLALPSLTGAIGPIALPSVAGFSLDAVNVYKHAGSQDDFLVIQGELAAGSNLAKLAQQYPVISEQLPEVIASNYASAGKVSYGRNNEKQVATTPRVNQHGDSLQWSYRIGNGSWSSFENAGTVVIPKLANEADIEWRHRVVGQPRTLATTREEVGNAKTAGCGAGSSTIMLLLLVLPLLTIRKSALVVLLAFGASCGGSNPQCKLSEDCSEICGGEGEIGTCFEDTCLCSKDVENGVVGQDLAMDVAKDGSIWIASYNATHGDLMVANPAGAGKVPLEQWDFIDGVPEGPIVFPHSKIRSGIFEEGVDVGRNPSIGAANRSNVYVSYHDTTNGSLKFASFINGIWNVSTLATGSDTAISGIHSKLRINDATQRPTVVYTVWDASSATSSVMFASATSKEPKSASDWLHLEVASGIASERVLVDFQRDQTGNPMVLFSDASTGLFLSRLDGGAFETPENVAVGPLDYPSLTVDDTGKLHFAFYNVLSRSLGYGSDSEASVVDDGFRTEGTTDNGLDIPVFHAVGADNQIMQSQSTIAISYQDATTHEIRLATKTPDGWTHSALIGDEIPFVGAYGFFANAESVGGSFVHGTWVVDLPTRSSWVEILSNVVVID